MAGSADFIANLGGETWQEALQTLRSSYGSGLAQWLGGHLGVTPRQIQRYMAAAGITSGAQRRSAAAHTAVLKRLAAAAVLRKARRFDAGPVDVEYEGQDEGTRNVRAMMPADFQGAARALEAGDVAMAAELFDQEVMRAYGAPNLDVTDYQRPDDFRLW